MILPNILKRSSEEGEDEEDDPNNVPPLNLPRHLIPPSETTGEPRHFTAQLLPTLLHSLRVDKTIGTDMNEQFAEGAMDFGNIMIYTTQSNEKDDDTAAFCVVQKAVDEAPAGRRKFKLVNLPDETGTAFPNNHGDEEASTFTDGCVDDDFTIDGEDDGDELW